jgi:hypothetical protein
MWGGRIGEKHNMGRSRFWHHAPASFYILKILFRISRHCKKNLALVKNLFSAAEVKKLLIIFGILQIYRSYSLSLDTQATDYIWLRSSSSTKWILLLSNVQVLPGPHMRKLCVFHVSVEQDVSSRIAVFFLFLQHESLRLPSRTFRFGAATSCRFPFSKNTCISWLCICQEHLACNHSQSHTRTTFTILSFVFPAVSADNYGYITRVYITRVGNDYMHCENIQRKEWMWIHKQTRKW